MAAGPPIGHHERIGGTAIEKKKLWILALGAASLTVLASLDTLGTAGAVSPAPVAAPPNYVTRCAQVETGSVDGFVSNQGSQSSHLRGEVRFLFSSGGAPSRPDQLVQSDVELPPGKPVRVARARLDPPLRDGEQCRLDVQSSVSR